MTHKDGIRSAALWLGALAALACARVAAAVDWTPATVRLSDGTTLQGDAYITNGRILLMNEAQKRRYSIRTEEMARIETSTEEQTMEEKWIFKESGLDDKVFTGKYYPVRHYMTKITFHDGREVEGHIIAATLYVKVEGEKQRFILRRKDEGKVDQKPEDLLYVEKIIFGDAGAGVRGTISGTVTPPQGEKLEKVLALNRTKLICIEARLEGGPGVFRFTDCTEGTYDLLVVTDRAVYLYMSRENDDGARRLDAAMVASINEWQARLRDFFHKREVVYAAGDEAQLFALVRMERYGGTTLAGAEMVRRYEIWATHMPQDEWQIEKRFFIYRVLSGDRDLPRRKICLDPALGGHKISAENPELKLSLKPAAAGETLIPKTPATEEQPHAGAKD